MEEKRQELDVMKVDLLHEGKQIILPGDPREMTYDEAIEAISRIQRDAEQEMDFSEIIEAHPEDGLVAIVKAMREIYNWVQPVSRTTFFGNIHPDVRMVKTGPNVDDVMEVPYGTFTLPGLDNLINIGPVNTHEGVRIRVSGTLRKHEMAAIRQLVARAREIVRTESIYKGKAIRLTSGNDGKVDSNAAPVFIDTSSIRRDEIVLNDDVMSLVEDSIFSPIRNTEECKRLQIPLNRAALLEGPYGTGKTLTGWHTACECVENGWTYILLDDVRGLKDALLMARQYQPAVIFAEDIDRVAGSRDQNGNDLLNVIDGVLTKDSEVITILTTNFVERIDPAMIRPGRLDSVIRVSPPDPKSIGKLIKLYGRGLIDENEDVSEASSILNGQIAAVIREVVERAKLSMVNRGDTKLSGRDLTTAAISMQHHLSILNRKQEEEPNVNERLGQALAEIVMSSNTNIGDVEERLSSIYSLLDSVDDKAIDGNGILHRIMDIVAGTGDSVSEVRKIVRDMA